MAVVVAVTMPIAQVGAQPTGRGANGNTAVSGQSLLSLTPMGTRSLRQIAAWHRAHPASRSTSGRELPPKVPGDDFGTPGASTAATPNPGPTSVSGQFPGVLPFTGLTHVDSRYADNGNQFSLEPPDQALCVGSGYTLDSVNAAVTVYDRYGNQLVPEAAVNEFFGVAPQIRRDLSSPTFGPFAFDPVCLYDPQVKRFFLLVTELDQDVFSGAFTGGSHLYLAVSQTSDPTGNFTFFGITTTNGDATDRGCPCFDDFPHIGSDSNGFYISTNRFPIFEAGYNGAQLYAASKRGLADAATGAAGPPPLVSINAGPAGGTKSDTVQPAMVPPNGSYAPDREYFLSRIFARAEHRLVVWALSNTDSLDTSSPNLELSRKVIESNTYVLPPKVVQRPGRKPLGDAVGEPLNKLDSGDTRMTEITYANGKLWGAVSTAVGPAGGPKRVGILWVQVKPTFAAGQVGGSVVRQGYVAVATNSLLYPAVGVTAAGRGAIVTSLAGPTVFPSAAYIEINNDGVTGPVRVPEFGQRPEDGFTCYAAFGSRDRGCRWGDYSAARADETGRIFMSTEYIPNAARTSLANWGTLVMRLTP